MSWEPLEGMPGVQINVLNVHEDPRGTLSEFWRNDELRIQPAPHVFTPYVPAMAYMSWTKPGVARGPHEHKEQTDLFVFSGPGAFLLYMWSYGQSIGTGDPHIESQVILPVGDPKTRLTSTLFRPMAVLVPPGIVHGYKCVSKSRGLVINMPDRLYRGSQKKGEVDEIRHEDDPESPYTIPSVL